MVGDTIRIIDRERGFYYEGGEAEYFLRETFSLDFDVAPLIRLALGAHPDCSLLSDLYVSRAGAGSASVTGKLNGEDFRVQFEGPRGRVENASWPVDRRGRPDRLNVRYTWGADALDRVEMEVEGREWRCRIARAN